MGQNSSGQLTILAIDRDAETLRAINEALTDGNYECHGATDVAAAGRQLGRHVPDLIITDVNLLGLSGLEVCQQLVREAGLPEVPVMLLSASQAPSVIRRCCAGSGIYSLRKPFDPAVLAELVQKACAARPDSTAANGRASATARGALTGPRGLSAAERRKSQEARPVQPRSGVLTSK